MIPEILFMVSGTLWAIEMIPQIIKTYKRKSVKDISMYFPLICIISFILYFTASYLTKNWILILSTSTPFVCNIILYRKGVRECYGYPLFPILKSRMYYLLFCLIRN